MDSDSPVMTVNIAKGDRKKGKQREERSPPDCDICENEQHFYRDCPAIRSAKESKEPSAKLVTANDGGTVERAMQVQLVSFDTYIDDHASNLVKGKGEDIVMNSGPYVTMQSFT